MAGSCEVGGLCVWVGEHFDCDGSVGGGDACCDAESFVCVDGDGERGAERCGVDGGLWCELEPIAGVGIECDAEHASGACDHEVDDLRRDELCWDDDVALVFAVFIVDEDDGAAGSYFFEDLGDGCEGQGWVLLG